jgi:glyoxylase-like metal-dependent hydrolase (beta-lactamase superfamily II)
MTMQTPQDMREVSGISPDPRVRVFRRTLHGLDEFEGLEVDAYVVLGKSHAVILDTLLCPADMAYVMATIEPELENRQLLCVNSHADWDHTWGNGYFNSTRYIPILAHEHCRQRLISPEAQLKLDGYKKKTAAFNEVTLVPPSLTFSERFTIADDSLPIELLHAPGHCRDQIVAWLPAIHLLLAFDAVEKPLPCIEDSSCVPLMFSTLTRLAALNAQHVLCSHGNTTSPTLIHENLAYLREIEQHARRLLEHHIPTTIELEQAAALINYPFDEVITSITDEVDRTYYSWAHEHNTQAILQSLIL